MVSSLFRLYAIFRDVMCIDDKDVKICKETKLAQQNHQNCRCLYEETELILAKYNSTQQSVSLGSDKLIVQKPRTQYQNLCSLLKGSTLLCEHIVHNICLK